MIARTEHDLLGDREVPADAYYGVHTLRAVENFPISGRPISDHTQLISALAAVKQAAARANTELGLLDQNKAAAIVAACEEIRKGDLHAGSRSPSTKIRGTRPITPLTIMPADHPIQLSCSRPAAMAA